MDFIPGRGPGGYLKTAPGGHPTDGFFKIASERKNENIRKTANEIFDFSFDLIGEKAGKSSRLQGIPFFYQL